MVAVNIYPATAPQWERTTSWHWRKVLLRQSWRLFRPGIGWGTHMGRVFNAYRYQTDKQRALEALDQSYNPAGR